MGPQLKESIPSPSSQVANPISGSEKWKAGLLLEVLPRLVGPWPLCAQLTHREV